MEEYMEEIKTLLQKLTLEEKVSLMSGFDFWTTRPIERLGIPSVKMTDGPHGLREEIEKAGIANVMKDSVPATCFPPAVTTAASWDKSIARDIAKAIGEEAIACGISTVLGPGTNIKRSPLCGRNFEYFSEDPYLAGELSSAYVDGIQSTKVGCSLKHFCANNQEYNRMAIDTIVDERTLREIYLPAFETTVKRCQPSQVMCSYNRLNGVFLSDNKRMLNDVLRNEWGFKGMVVSDWGAVNNRVEGVKAGMDLEMPGNRQMNDRHIIRAYNEGRITMEEIDSVVTHILEYVDRSEKAKQAGYKCDYAAHHALARKAAAQGAVLLKNENDVLPFGKKDKITVIGKLAEKPRYQGGGSSQIHCINLVSILDALKAENIAYEYADGYSLKGDGYDAKLLKEAVELAKGKDKVVVVIGLTDEYESEGFDRTNMDLPVGHNKLIDEIAKVNDKIAVILVCGSPVTLPWSKRVSAILNTYLGGEATGEATVDVLFGDVNPSGKLAETFPKRLSDNIVSAYFPMGTRNVQYRESVYVGYRYFDSARKSVRYPFGFGLSYTTFEYSNLALSAKKIKDTDTLKVTFDITNTGKTAGAETAQVYVSDIESTIFRPEKELKGFEKVYLNAGETKTVEIELSKRAFAFYNVGVSDWTVESGDFDILVGSSSQDIKLCERVTVSAPEVKIPAKASECNVYYHISEVDAIPSEQFTALYGAPIQENTPLKRGEFNINSNLEEISTVPLGRFIRFLITSGARALTKGSTNKTMAVNGVLTTPLRSFSNFTGGAVSQMSVDGLVDMLNKTKGGFNKFCKGFSKKNRKN